MKCLNRCLALFLCIIMVLSVPNTVFAVNSTTDSEDVQVYSIPIISNEYNGSYVTFYGVGGKFYLSFDDIKELARFELEETDTTITLTQGSRELVIEKSSGHLVDCDLVNQGNIAIIQYDGKYLCEGIPMLRYLGAECALNENQVLEVMMPTITIWESIMPNYLDYYFNITELYSGEDNVKISLAFGILADVLDGVSGHGLFANGDTHLEDALYEILNVDMMKYESVQEIVSDQNQKINDFLSSAVFGTMLDTGDNMYDAVYEALDYYSKFYVSAKNDILLDMMFQTDDLDYASELASQIKEQVYAQSATKANLKNAKKAQSFMDIGMLAFDTAITSYSMMQYNDDTKNLFARTINQEMFEYANYYDISWNNVSDKISNTLKSTQSIVANTAINNVAEFAVEKVTEEGAKTAFSAFTSKANIYTMAIQIGSFIASLINYESNQAFSADMNAIWLSTVQYDIAQLTSRMLVKERDEYHFSDAESLTKLKDMFTLYYRTIIAFSENITKSIEEFGGKNRNEWMQYFGGTSGNSVCNYAAIYLYRITNCTVVPIVEYSSLKDDLLTSDGLETFKQENSDIFGLLPSEFVFTSGAGGWATEITLNGDGTFNGQYQDSDPAYSGTRYPDGTVYICDFSGKFTMPKKISEYIYTMNLESLHVEGTPGEVYYENDKRYIVSEPYGFDNANEFQIYLPGASIAELPNGFLFWAYLDSSIRDTIPKGFYGLYNVGGEEGFIGMDDNSIWNKNYVYYNNNGYRSELLPSYNGVSTLMFLPKSGASIISLLFNWSEDNQTEFNAYDYNGSGDYHLLFDISDDSTTITIRLSSVNGMDMSAWGGTTNGELTAIYTDEKILTTTENNINNTVHIDSNNIPAGAVSFNNHYYYIYDIDDVTTWEEAKQYCEAQGGYMATITSKEEDDFLFSYITDLGYTSVLFGLSDIEEPDIWTWVTGEDVIYENWASGEPNHQGGYEHYGQYYGKNPDGTWNDGSGKTCPFLCEWGEY